MHLIIQLKFYKHKVAEIQREILKSTITGKDFNMPTCSLTITGNKDITHIINKSDEEDTTRNLH